MKQIICTLTLLASLIVSAGAVDDIIGTINVPLALAGLAGMGLSVLIGGLETQK